MIENPLAQRLLQGDFISEDTILATASDGKLVFNKA
jgi:ATP-dependent Clp protease ATP-binding subunit ClpB